MDTSQTPPLVSPQEGRFVMSPFRWIQERIATRFAVSAQQREVAVRRMMVRAPGEDTGYWLQLVLSMCIATFGLVLNSSGVVIGAMLIAPLMVPIIELAMSLTVGSPYLTLRSLLRSAISVLFVVAGSALITLWLPFQEVTAEIAARTTPTVLDLFVAIFCAFAAAFAVVRASSDTIATAAGTSISIALVPPLCVVGFGIGNQLWPVARGAALLFTANLSAILMFAALFFWGLSFNTVDAEAAEREVLVERSSLGRLSARLWRLIGHRYGPILRILVPLALFGAVYIPLSQALGEVAWQVRVRGYIKYILAQEIPEDRAVQTSLRVERKQISLRVVVVSKPERAAELEAKLRARIGQVSGTAPGVRVLAVPDDQAVRETALTLSHAQPAMVQPRPPPNFGELRTRLSQQLSAEWPAGAAGPLLDWRLGWEDGHAVIELTHLGPPLGEAGEQMLTRRLAEALLASAAVRDRPIDPRERLLDLARPESSWSELIAARTTVQEHLDLSLCVWLPAPTLPKRPDAHGQEQNPTDSIRSALTGLGSRATVRESDRPRLRIQREPCVPINPVDAGTADAPLGPDAGPRTP